MTKNRLLSAVLHLSIIPIALYCRAAQSASAVTASGIAPHGGNTVAETKARTEQRTINPEDINKRRAVTVQVINGEQKGSGFIIRDQQKRLWITTNRHVVGDAKEVCITFADKTTLQGSVYTTKTSEYDIAFISVAHLKKEAPFAELDSQFEPGGVNPVIATGYSADGNTYLETTGVTVPILGGKRLDSGYSLTYSNQIEKGMSGGGIFSEDDQVIGMNALHSDPLWPGDWYDENGKKLRRNLGKKLDSVSVGIAIQTIRLSLDLIDLKRDTRLITLKCTQKAVRK